MTSSRDQNFGMHDLNALAKNNLLELHMSSEAKNRKWTAPPFLPVAGVTFASHLATEMLAGLIQAQAQSRWVSRVASLDEAVQNLLSPLYSKKLRESTQKEFLHNGRYPCYAIYPLKDKGFLAVASVEQKYWDRFCKAFNLNIDQAKRFLNDEKVFSCVAEGIASFNFKEATEICVELDACVSLVKE